MRAESRLLGGSGKKNTSQVSIYTTATAAELVQSQ